MIVDGVPNTLIAHRPEDFLKSFPWVFGRMGNAELGGYNWMHPMDVRHIENHYMITLEGYPEAIEGTPTMAQVFDLAAEEHLGFAAGEGELFSCGAVYMVLKRRFRMSEKEKNEFYYQIRLFWDEMGMLTYSFGQFDYVCNSVEFAKEHGYQEIEAGIERQSYRYSWLKFCAMIAEEWGM